MDYCAHTNKVFHHLRGVVRRRGDAQELVAPGNGGIVDCLDVDVVATHHDVTHLCVFLRVRHLQIETHGIRTAPHRETHLGLPGTLFQNERGEARDYPDWDDVAGAVHHWQPRVHQHLPEQLDVALVFASQSAALLPFENLDGVPGAV